jgi:hypothetical protein
MDLRVFTASQGHALARSVALIMAEMPEAFPPAGTQASMEVAMAAVDGIDSRIYAGLAVVENFKNCEEHHATYDLESCSN